MLDEILRKELDYDDLIQVSVDEVTKEDLKIKKVLNPITDPINKEQLRVMKEMANSIFELRLSKVLEGKPPTGFDKGIMEAVMRMKRFYVSFLSSELVIKNGKVLCTVKNELIFKGKKLSEGDIVLLDFTDAVLFYITNYITPCSLFKSDNDEGSKEP